MDSDAVIDFVVILFILEWFETTWQKGSSFNEMIGHIKSIYERNMLLFFSLHPAFYFLIYIMLYTNNYSFLIVSVLFMKLMDITLKISIIDKIARGKSLGGYEILLKEDVKISPVMKYFGTFLYPIMVYLALTT
jgi:hypothetical protein